MKVCSTSGSWEETTFTCEPSLEVVSTPNPPGCGCERGQLVVAVKSLSSATSHLSVPSVLIANIKGCEFHWTLGHSGTSWLVRNLTQGPWILPDPRIPVHTPSLHPHQQTSTVSHLCRPEVSWRQHLKASASSQEIIFQHLSTS